ncbi:hypothetical protein Goari_010089 [Gossypium aridum]|uniref:DUF4283 domain-containing protein n=1 Tax=Gossypium aridum TaxID=34290 RepID=A0A7J8XYY3_GOSAI|nr:hypothetical protein [Gossypium aridum]
MEDYMASLSLEEVEEDFIQLGAESVDNGIYYANCFVGMFLTSIMVHFQAMRSILANVWHPIGGVSISDLENGRFLFRFYFEVDADRVERNDPWNFNSHLLVLHRLVQGENPLTVQLTEVNFWILVNDIPHVQLAYKGIMRLRVRLDVGSPLKRKKKLLLPNWQLIRIRNVVLSGISHSVLSREELWLGGVGSWWRMVAKKAQGSSSNPSLPSKGKSNTSILIGPIVRSGLGHSVNIVNGSFDDEMAIREEENSPMCNLDGLNRPRTLSFASGVSVNKDSIEVSAILMQVSNQVRSTSFDNEASWKQ